MRNLLKTLNVKKWKIEKDTSILENAYNEEYDKYETNAIKKNRVFKKNIKKALEYTFTDIKCRLIRIELDLNSPDYETCGPCFIASFDTGSVILKHYINDDVIEDILAEADVFEEFVMTFRILYLKNGIGYSEMCPIDILKLDKV